MQRGGTGITTLHNNGPDSRNVSSGSGNKNGWDDEDIRQSLAEGRESMNEKRNVLKERDKMKYYGGALRGQAHTDQELRDPRSYSVIYVYYGEVR